MRRSDLGGRGRGEWSITSCIENSPDKQHKVDTNEGCEGRIWRGGGESRGGECYITEYGRAHRGGEGVEKKV